MKTGNSIIQGTLANATIYKYSHNKVVKIQPQQGGNKYSHNNMAISTATTW